MFHRKVLNLEAFFKYLFGDTNPSVSPTLGVHNDMNTPLSYYFIYTGHNSYLTGNQLSSDCSDVPIIQALHRGVRVIELDIWPNSNKDDVDVLHGGAQGACKFGFYEFFKKYYSDLAGPEFVSKYKTLIYLAGSASDEVITDVALCPFEAVKVRVQTQLGFARGLSDGLPKFVRSEGALG